MNSVQFSNQSSDGLESLNFFCQFFWHKFAKMLLLHGKTQPTKLMIANHLAAIHAIRNFTLFYLCHKMTFLELITVSLSE